MKIQLRLSEASINEAVKQIEAYRDSLAVKQARLMNLLASKGYEIVVRNISQLNLPFSQNGLISGAMFTSTERTATIYVISDHAIYVEFGTGIVGKTHPNPHNTIGYAYDVNNHGDNGWYYYSNGRLRWTKGMPSRPFMHNSYMELRNEIHSIAKEVFYSD